MTDTNSTVKPTGMKAVPATKKEELPVPELPPVPESFKIWVGQRGQKAKGAFEALIAIPGLTLVFGLLARDFLPSNQLNIKAITIGVLLFQAVTVSVLFAFIPKAPKLQKGLKDRGPAREKLQRLEEGADKFTDLWSRAWACWALLYFGLGVSLLLQDWFPNLDLWAMAPLKNFLNNMQTAFFLMCFRELRKPTHHDKSSPLFAAILIVVVVAVFEALFLIPGNPVRDNLGLPLSKVLGWASGCIGGTAIALLVGRLETKLIDAPVLMTTLFYLYASIQGAFPFLTNDSYLTLVFTSLAFLFKLLLFLFMAWLIQSGVLQFYFSKMLELDDRTPEQRREFLMSAVRKAE